MNRKRFSEMDFARVIPLLFLPIVHIYEDFSLYESLSEKALADGEILLYLCAFGPSIFMMILGMNIAFTSHNSPNELARRGVKTLIIAMLLNVMRFMLPAFVIFLQGEDWALMDGFISCCMSDILPFAGMAFLFFALMRKWDIKPLHIILLTLVLLSVHTLIMPEDMESTWYTQLLGNFVHCTEWSSFPVLAWLIYPAIGYSIGLHMLTFENEEQRIKFYKKVLLVSAVCLLSLGVALNAQGLNVLLIAAAPANDNITELLNVMLDVFIGGVFVTLFSFIYFKLQKVVSKRVNNFITDLSRAIMIFYIIQWIAVGWTEYMLAPKYSESYALGSGFVLISSVVIMLISVTLAIPIKKALDRRKLAKSRTKVA